jgi:cell pole-organizing protein PopZ
VLELQDPVGEGDGLVSDDAALGAAVRELLKPLLKDWLDRNLPDMVEELVTREIARITGKSF